MMYPVPQQSTRLASRLSHLHGLAIAETVFGIFLVMFSVGLCAMPFPNIPAGVTGILSCLFGIIAGLLGVDGFRTMNDCRVTGHFALNIFAIFLDVAVLTANVVTYVEGAAYTIGSYNVNRPSFPIGGHPSDWMRGPTSNVVENYVENAYGGRIIEALIVVMGFSFLMAIVHLILVIISCALICHSWSEIMRSHRQHPQAIPVHIAPHHPPYYTQSVQSIPAELSASNSTVVMVPQSMYPHYNYNAAAPVILAVNPNGGAKGQSATSNVSGEQGAPNHRRSETPAFAYPSAPRQ